jgi:hypothetical protein
VGLSNGGNRLLLRAEQWAGLVEIAPIASCVNEVNPAHPADTCVSGDMRGKLTRLKLTPSGCRQEASTYAIKFGGKCFPASGGTG